MAAIFDVFIDLPLHVSTHILVKSNIKFDYDLFLAENHNPSLIFLFLFAPLGIMGLIGAGVCFFTSGSVEKANQQQIANINAEYDAKIAAGKKKIDDILTEWKKAKTIVDSYENGAIPDVVA